MGASWWNTWYESATQAVSGSMQAAQQTVSSLFKEPPTGSIAYTPDDAPLSDILRARQSGTVYDLYPVEPGPFALTTDLQQQILSRPKSWDEMSWWEKAKAYTTNIIPNAAFETFGVTRSERGTTEDPGVYTGPSDRLRSGAVVAGENAEAVLTGGVRTVGNVVQQAGGTLSRALGGLPGFLQGTLTRVIIILALAVAIIFLANRFLMRRGL